MKLRFVSDLHFEFMKDQGAAMSVELTRDRNFDVLVVAGDLASYKTLYPSLAMLAAAAGDKPVVYVLGNHEAYGATWGGALAEARRAQQDHPNLTVLERETAVIAGQRFVGCTLWFPHPPWAEREDQWIGDFHYIADIYDFIHTTAKESADFLAETIQPGDIVVTHHLPHPNSVHARYAGSQLNRFFLHNLSHLVQSKKARFWIHGHTHTSFDYKVGQTRVLCNPFGYAVWAQGEPNREFKVRTLTYKMEEG